MKRRILFIGAAGAAGALLVGWGVLPQRSRIGSPKLLRETDGQVALNGWIKIDRDGIVTLAMPRSEMGQGIHTALPMLAAEELDVELGNIRIEQAGSDSIYGNVHRFVASLPFIHPQDAERTDGFGRVVRASQWITGKLGRELGINATGGSTSVSDLWGPIRTAAATARAMLVGAASLHWRLPMEELSVESGRVSHPSGRSSGYGELARFAASTPPGEVRLKPRGQWRVIGRPLPRVDAPAKVDGSATYGIDIRLPGLKFAVVRLSPVLGGTPGRVDATEALQLPGVERLVQLPAYAGSAAGIALVGKSYWHADRAARAVKVDWRPPPGPLPDSGRIHDELRRLAEGEGGLVFYSRGSTGGHSEETGRSLEATYSAPFLAHLAMEPLNCTALVQQGRVELWAPTQVPEMCRTTAARVAGVPPDQVAVHVTLLGGGFGRRLEVDYVAYAVRVAMDCQGSPVQLIWSREEDTQHDFFRPMHVAKMRGSLDPGGLPSSLRISSAGDAITPAYLKRALPELGFLGLMPDKTAAEGLSDLPYDIPNQHVAHVPTSMGVPVGYWRSVGHSHNAFFSESFIDELARLSGRDPVQFRRRMLAASPRHLAVLELAAEKSQWVGVTRGNRGFGVALHESFGSVVAQIAEVSMSSAGMRVHRVVCAIDCGTVVNSQLVAQQMEGAVIYGLSAALFGRIDIRNGTVEQRNYPGQPLIRMDSAPVVETWVVSSERDPSGVGEPGVPPVAPAVANALFAIDGVRRRKLPLLLP